MNIGCVAYLSILAIFITMALGLRLGDEATPQPLMVVMIYSPVRRLPTCSTAMKKTDDLELQASKKTDVKTGLKCQAIDIYPCPRYGGWTQKYPTHYEEAAKNVETAQSAILKRNKKSSVSRKKFDLHSIIVQSSLLKKVLGRVFKGCGGVPTQLERLEFDAPFMHFVHRWEKFSEARNSEADPETNSHLDLLWDILYQELKIVLETRNDLLAHGVMAFKYLVSPSSIPCSQDQEISSRTFKESMNKPIAFISPQELLKQEDANSTIM